MVMTTEEAINFIEELIQYERSLTIHESRLIKALWEDDERKYSEIAAKTTSSEDSLKRAASALLRLLEPVLGYSKNYFHKNRFPELKEILEKEYQRYLLKPDEYLGNIRNDNNSSLDKNADCISNEDIVLPECVNNIEFKWIIDDKTQDFVGREYIFKAIQYFIADNKNGYFAITGDPGQGKSAILAKYVQDTNCIAHFNSSLQGGSTRTDQFLQSICDQLIKRYQLPYESLPPNATRDGVFLLNLLEESAKKRNGQSIIITVDALDEVDQGSYRGSSENILFLPPYLPDDVYFILTKRRGVDIPLMVYTPFNELSLLDYQSDSERDVKTYIQNRINSSGELRLQIAERGETIEDFTNKISDKSENNFMYLRFILPNIEKGKYKKDLTLEEFPQGLEGYYEFHWRRMGMTKKPLPIIKIKIVYLLTENYEPVSLGLLAKYASHSSSKKISKILIQDILDEDELSQFLHRQEIEEEICYRVYHSSFIDFLNRKNIVKAAGIEITEIHRSIADTLWEGLYGEEE